MNIITDNRISKAILNKICKEHNIERSNVTIDKDFGYVVTENFDKRDADFCTTNYKGNNYKVMYHSGCFNPYITKLD
jgi:hypothetical protein